MNKNRESTTSRNAEFYKLYEQSLEELLQKCPPEINVTSTEVIDYMITNKKTSIRLTPKRVIQCVRDHIKTRSHTFQIEEARRLLNQAEKTNDNQARKFIERKVSNIADLNPNIEEIQSIAKKIKTITNKLETA